MQQSKLESFIESWVNIVIGFTLNYFGNLIILPMFGFNVTPGKAFGIGVFFTIISLVRSYYIRRIFNRYGSGGWVQFFRTLKERYSQ